VAEAIPAPAFHRGRSAGIVGIVTLLVSVVGYLREASLASRFGVSATMDAYFGALFIPNILYIVLILGTLSPIFIPILLQDNAAEDRAKASETFSVITTFVLLVLLVVVACGMIAAPRWLPLLFVGYDAATLAVTVRLIYIIFPGVLFLAMSGILTAALNGFHRFALPAVAPALSSVVIIAAALLARGNNAVYVVGIATAAGFTLQGLFLVPATASLGIRYRPKLAFRHPAIRKLLRLGGPLLLYLVVANASVLWERNLASRLSAGAVSTLTYALRLFTVPANFLAVPLAIVTYPQFAREALREQRGDLSNQVSRMFRMVAFLFLPVAVWTILNALPITRVLYEHGRFLAADSLVTARVLAIYAWGILPNAIAIILLRSFFAIEDTVTPLVVELIDLVVFVLVASALTSRWGITGLAVSRSLTFFLVTAIFVGVLWNRRLLILDWKLARFLVEAATATLAMGMVSWASLYLLQPSFEAAATLVRLGIVALVFTLSATTFLGVARLFKMEEATRVVSTAWGLLPGRLGANNR
jgi:putative peptidoglycan lipid II flippase